MQNHAKVIVRIIAGILILSLVAGLAVMAFADENDTVVLTTAEDLAGLSQLGADANIVLGANIDMTDVEFTSAGTAEAPFTGTFNGNGYVISNLEGSALLAYASGATVENVLLTHGSFSGEYAGAVIGKAENCTLNNVIVDGTNTVSGTYAGGLVGYVEGTLTLNGCHAGAVMDVYADLCGDYHFYQYTGAGMLVGAVEGFEVNQYGTMVMGNTGITAEGCTIAYGDWNQYVYCEQEANGTALYTSDYKFSRVSACDHTHTEAEEKNGIALPFAQMVGSAWMGVAGVDIEGVTATETNTIAEKFVPKTAETVVGESLKLSDIFEGSSIASTVAYTVNGEQLTTEDWENTEIKFEAAGTYTVTIVEDRFCMITTNTVTVGKADPTVPEVGTLNATYGDTLVNVTLPTGFAWKDSSLSVGNAGTNSHTAVYTPTDTDNYNTVEVEVSVEVAKADPTVPEVGTLNATYGDTLVNVTLPTGFAWKDSSLSVGNAGTNSHTSVYTPTDTDNYNTVEVEVSVVVAKAEPEYTVPSGLTATYGDQLSSVKLEEGFAWETTGTVGNAGTNKFTVSYTPDDTANYNVVTGIEVTIEVAKAEPEYTVPSGLKATYGDDLSSVKLEEGFAWETTGTVGNAGTNKFTVSYTPDDTANYNVVTGIEVSVAVAKANPTYTVPTRLTATEGDILAAVTLPAGFAWKDSSLSVGSAGTNSFTAVYTPNDTANYNTVEVAVSVEVAAKVVVITDKFAQKMPAADFTYRLGNGNTVALSSLLKALDGAEIDSSTVTVTVAAVDGAVVSGTHTANTTDWTKGTIQFTGTGVVEVTISDATSNPFTLTFEIVNAKNATSAASATANNVVLLNDMGFSTITVSNGYTLFGNGFTMTCSTDIGGWDLGECNVALDHGHLDNVRVIVPNFANTYLYWSQAKNDTTNRDPSQSDDYRLNIRTAVFMDGISTISNSYISGGRAAVYVRSGKAVIEDTMIRGGAVANVLVGRSVTMLTLRDMTLVQKPTEGKILDTTKTIIGFSVLMECDENGESAPLTVEGKFDQFAWVRESDKTYFPDDLQTIVGVIMGKTDYIHTITVDGITDDWVNLGIAYAYLEGIVTPKTPSLVDNRADKDAKPYSSVEIAALAKATIYSYNNSKRTGGESETMPAEPAITANAVTTPAVTFDAAVEGMQFATSYDTTYGWMSKLEVDLDTTGDYTFNFANLLVSKYGKNLSYTVTDENGATVGSTVALTDSGVHTYTLHITDNMDCNGSTTMDYTFVLTATKTSIAPPEKVAEPGGTPLLVVKSKNSDWSCAIPALEGTQIKYYNKTSGAYETLSLSSLVPSSTGKANGTNNYWTYTCNDYTLKITCGYIHETKQVYGMPVVVNNSGNKMYFTISSTNGYVSTSTTARTVTITYDFTDSNGQTLTFSKTWQFNYADYKNGTQYSYSDFCNGTLKEASSGCVTGDTLVTLADGSQKQIQDVTYADQLLVWDFYKGEYAVVPAAIIFDHGYGNNTVIKLNFSDGTAVDVVNLHQFMDATENQFVTIDAQTVAQYVGHEFVKQDGNGYKTVILESYTVSEEYVEAYGIISAGHYNILVNGMWSTDFMWEDYDLFNYFRIGENMMFDQEAMQADIEAYGLYTYEDFSQYLTYEQFVGFNVQYFKIAVGKGLYTYEGILNLIHTYLGQ